MKQFDNQDEAIGYLRTTLIGNTSFIEMTQLIEPVSNLFMESYYPTPPKGTLGMMIKRWRWVIKDDDIQIVASILEAIKSAAGAGFIIGTGTMEEKSFTALIGVIGGLHKLGRNIQTKGKKLSQDQYDVLLILKLSDGLTFDQLFVRLNLNADRIKKDELTTLVRGLLTVYTEDGSSRTLVVLDNGVYRVSGI